MMSYRSNEQSTTGMAPSKLLHGRTMKTRLNKELTKLPFDQLDVDMIAKENVKIWQNYTKNRDKTRNRSLSKDDWVRTMKPSMKGYILFKPVKISEIVKPRTYKLSDNFIWNGSRLTNSQNLSNNKIDDILIDVNTEPSAETINDIGITDIPSKRVRRKPAHLNDYILDTP
ncbi:hypothetical protein A3Q56_05341 [Intoshia linei]|uniref:Uncharacterized protein n=1 Tax=Intoshia linei TaxID=1819745 RepID=A0A177AY15_9BILA|nr:hypothetical protein A3Q56_05341 [Intoshia linei]